MSRFHLVQTRLSWEDPAANLAHFDRLLAPLDTAADDLVILPEMFSTGFSMNAAALAEPMDGATVNWMRQTAARLGCSLCGSVIIRDDGRHYNRFILATPGGHLEVYDKRHLFRMSGEHEHYAPGTAAVTLTACGVRVFPQVCYDLRFPAWSRNRTGYDVLLYVANWPAARREQWLALLKARAIENLCYVIAVNRIGPDGKGVDHAGDSCVFGPRGELLLDLADRDTIAGFEPDAAALRDYRATFPAHLDADDFEFSPGR